MSRFEEEPIPQAEPEPIPEPEPVAPEPEEVIEEPTEDQSEEPEPGETPEEHKKRKGGYQRKLEKAQREAEQARAEAAYLRGQMDAIKPKEEAQAKPIDGRPSVDQFDSYDEYVEALTDWKLEQREAKKENSKVESSWRERESLAQNKYEDYDEVADIKQLLPTPAMAQTILQLELGADVLYWLGKHPQENARIRALSPLAAAAALGKIESQLAKPTPKPKTTQAPAPISPVTPVGTGNPVKQSSRYESY